MINNTIINPQDVKDVKILAHNSGATIEEIKDILNNKEDFFIIDNQLIRTPENNQLTLTDVKGGRIYTRRGWVNMLPHERFYYMDLMKKFLLSKCRSGSKAYRAINNINLDNIKNIPSDAVAARVVYEKRRNKVLYIAGQDERWEMQYLKNNIIKACY